MNIEKEYLLPKMPIIFEKNNLEDILIHAENLGASDIHIEGNNYIVFDVYGKLKPVTNRIISIDEAETLLKRLYAESAITDLNKAEAIDTSYTFKIRGSKLRYRYRINAIGTKKRGDDSLQITIRTIPDNIPTKSQLGLEDEIWENFVPSQGMVIVTGPTGSGKSTLLAACIREILETKNMNKKIITYEAPIEFTYDSIISDSCIISQTEVPTQIKTFNLGVEAAMRRKPNIILIGEARDRETIENSVRAAQTGHLLYTTSHTNGVAETIRRMINMYSAEERDSILFDLIDVMQLIVSQRLLPSTDGKRVAIKEYLYFDQEIKEKLLSIDSNQIVELIRKEVRKRKQSLVHDAIRKYKEGKITKEVLIDFAKTFGVNLKNKVEDYE